MQVPIEHVAVAGQDEFHLAPQIGIGALSVKKRAARVAFQPAGPLDKTIDVRIRL
jgi:hypothetical protein